MKYFKNRVLLKLLDVLNWLMLKVRGWLEMD